MFITFKAYLPVYYAVSSLYVELYSLSGSSSHENKQERTEIA